MSYIYGLSICTAPEATPSAHAHWGRGSSVTREQRPACAPCSIDGGTAALLLPLLLLGAPQPAVLAVLGKQRRVRALLCHSSRLEDHDVVGVRRDRREPVRRGDQRAANSAQRRNKLGLGKRVGGGSGLVSEQQRRRA